MSSQNNYTTRNMVCSNNSPLISLHWFQAWVPEVNEWIIKFTVQSVPQSMPIFCHNTFKQAFYLIAKTETINSEADDANYTLFKKSSLQVFGSKMRRVKQKLSGENEFESCIIKRLNLRKKPPQTSKQQQKNSSWSNLISFKHSHPFPVENQRCPSGM